MLKEMAGLEVARSTLCRAVGRLAKSAEPSYEKLVDNVRGSEVVYPDETGWRIGGQSAWLWVFVTQEQTVYRIAKGRGYAEASGVLGEDYSGLIGSDGWAPYRRFSQATRQACLAHLLRRCREMQEVATGSAAQFPREVQTLLQAALAVRDRRDAQQISPRPSGFLEIKLRRVNSLGQVVVVLQNRLVEIRPKTRRALHATW